MLIEKYTRYVCTYHVVCEHTINTDHEVQCFQALGSTMAIFINTYILSTELLSVLTVLIIIINFSKFRGLFKSNTYFQNAYTKVVDFTATNS